MTPEEARKLLKEFEENNTKSKLFAMAYQVNHDYDSRRLDRDAPDYYFTISEEYLLNLCYFKDDFSKLYHDLILHNFQTNCAPKGTNEEDFVKWATEVRERYKKEKENGET